MRHFMKTILSLFLICTLGFSTVAGATLCDMQSVDKVSDQQIMSDCHNMDQTSDDEAPQKSSCDHCFHCMQFVHINFESNEIIVPYTAQYTPVISSLTPYIHSLESPPPKV